MDRCDLAGVTWGGFGVIFRCLRIVVIRKELEAGLHGVPESGVTRRKPKLYKQSTIA